MHMLREEIPFSYEQDYEFYNSESTVNHQSFYSDDIETIEDYVAEIISDVTTCETSLSELCENIMYLQTMVKDEITLKELNEFEAFCKIALANVHILFTDKLPKFIKYAQQS